MGIEFYDDWIDDPRYDDFAAETKVHDDRLRVLMAEAEQKEQHAYDALARGDLDLTKIHAAQAHGNAVAAQAEGKEIDRMARAILRADQASSSNYIGKIAPTPARKAFLHVHRNSELTPEEREPSLAMITLSPDGAAWAVLVSERVIRGPFPAAHDIIAASTEQSWLYSSINSMPFPDGEAAIRRSPKLWARYQARWGLYTTSAAQRCPDCGSQLRNGRCDKHGPRTAGATA